MFANPCLPAGFHRGSRRTALGTEPTIIRPPPGLYQEAKLLAHAALLSHLACHSNLK
jgi:hypothetical protein